MNENKLLTKYLFLMMLQMIIIALIAVALYNMTSKKKV